MDILHNMVTGFGVALTPVNVVLCLVGCFIGTLIGVLPGIGPAATIALLLPVTFTLPPATAIIMLSGIYYGVAYGGTLTSVLMNIPGEGCTVVTCIDGYQMALQGRAGPALGIVSMLCQVTKGLVHRSGRKVLEGCWLHRTSSPGRSAVQGGNLC